MQMKFDHVAAVPVRQEEFEVSGAYSRFGKRVFDLLIALVMAPVIVPVIAVLWILVRRDGGPGMFVQERVGQSGEIFKCLKLRTMLVDAEKVLEDMCAANPEIAEEWHTNQKLRVDPRITRVGAFLRATSLDELPQFFNVLRGEMSFVGPRPFMPSQQDLYDAEYGASAYYAVKPGITGPWQVDGRGVTTFAARAKFDYRYLEKLSLMNDIKLMFRTVQVVLQKTGH